MPWFHNTLIVGLAIALSACAARGELACKSSERLAVHESLYFGTARPNGTVSYEQWREFLKATITPRFPLGLTVWQATGQWRSANGEISRESSYVLVLVHPDDVISERAVLEIVEIYKSRFQQEAVLRVRASACMSF
ncbi:conserved exported hypothetical protein [Candidatus Methylobacter favarea]|uniref:DUF3574 domain-containing protein n=1 Tax=Candidatus Methylobacter favarea TaxID=2707345 RepID=A0A8S0XHU8_9GAMM|nr:DUF3574 domain-containing protein [Candidatus Methylobacter favarea]CAA9892123.1 conserved exported hypothetical protein [Candidatus Methylobacter favarea]